MRIVIYCSLILLALPLACKKEADAPVGTTEEKRVARYKIALYKEAGNQKAWVATLNRGEAATITKLEGVTVGTGEKAKQVEYALVRIAGGKEGYIEPRHLARDVVLLKSGAAKIYQRPIPTSGEGTGQKHLAVNAIAFVEGEDFQDGAWLEIAGGTYPATYFKGWIRAEDTVKNEGLLPIALKLEELAQKAAQAEEKEELEKHLAALAELERENEPIATRAREIKASLSEKLGGLAATVPPAAAEGEEQKPAER